MTWTDARIAQLARLWSEGVSAAGIAEALGDVSRSAVLGKLHRLRLLRSRQAASPPRRYARAGGLHPAIGVAARAEAAAGPAVLVRREPPEPPHSPWREAAFAPLPGTAPRPWLARAFGECAFPVGGEGDGLLSCCAPTRPRSGYCPAHHAVVFKPVSAVARAAEHRRWAEAVQRWAA